jgi:putative membrane protein
MAQAQHIRPPGTIAPAPAAPVSAPGTKWYRRINWRVAAVRVPTNGLAVALAAFLLGGIHVTTDRPVIGYLVLGAVFGLLNAFVKPALQYVALPLLLESFGLVVVIVDVLVFWLLDLLFSNVVVVDGFWWYVAGGALLGFLSFLVDNVVGLTPPIIDDRPGREWSAS